MKRVLSIQSHVVYGTVGNKAAVPTLEMNGIDVAPLNVCQLSNHLLYTKATGSRVSLEEFQDIVSGLEVNGLLLNTTALLTGFIGNKDLLAFIAEVYAAKMSAGDSIPASDEKTGRPLFLCDPVCGDDGRLYVPADVPAVYRDKLIPLADITTPNGFEASLISGVAVESGATALEACAWFHAAGVGKVIITSYNDADNDGKLTLTGSDKDAGETFSIIITPVDGKFVGTGDIFSALLLAKIIKGQGLKEACHEAIAAMRLVLLKTKAESKAIGSTPPEIPIALCRDILMGTVTE